MFRKCYRNEQLIKKREIIITDKINERKKEIIKWQLNVIGSIDFEDFFLTRLDDTRHFEKALLLYFSFCIRWWCKRDFSETIFVWL